MSDLTEFVLARIAEDEAVARQVYPDGDGYFALWEDGDHGEVGIGASRVLAECEAKRRIVALHADDWNPRGLCMACDTPGPCPTARALALPYATHADYREEWKP